MVRQLHSPYGTARAYAQSFNSNASAATFNRITVSNTACAEVGDAHGYLVFLPGPYRSGNSSNLDSYPLLGSNV